MQPTFECPLQAKASAGKKDSEREEEEIQNVETPSAAAYWVQWHLKKGEDKYLRRT